jgi:hypothetical protein
MIRSKKRVLLRMSIVLILLFRYVPLIASQVDYLIICHDSLLSSAEMLKKYRENDGYRVFLVKLSEIGTGSPAAQQVDDWIESFNPC